MFTWRRLRLIRGLVGSASAGSAWWLFYLMGAWTTAPRWSVTFICFFLCIVWIDRILGALLDVLMLLRKGRSRESPTTAST
jgi:hypothetical protein